MLINCSAFHNVDLCEREPAAAFAINALAVDGAAQACAARGVAFATFSTDYVFDGAPDGALGRAYREDDAVGPRTAYGASKAAGEFLTRRHGDRHYVVRTSGVFGTTGTSNKGYTLIEKVLRQAERGEPTRMVADMIFSPSYAPHVARAVADLVDAQAFGTHHVVNAGACSWYEFVRTAFAKAGLAGAPLEPVTYAAMNNPTRRPMHSPLREHDVRARRHRAAAAVGDGARRVPRSAASAHRRRARLTCTSSSPAAAGTSASSCAACCSSAATRCASWTGSFSATRRCARWPRTAAGG